MKKVMEKIKINKAEIELLEYIPDFYSIAKITNPLLSEMRPGIKTWVSEDVFQKMQVSIWIVNDIRVNAFAKRYEGKNSNRDFSNYQEKDIESYDHPYPGIRMYYCSLAICDLLIRVKGDNELTRELISSGFDAMISYEKRALGKEKYRDSYFSIAGTKKGAMHIRALVNGWNELVDEYNRYSYVTIYKNDNVESLSYFLGEDGEFLRQGV